ncbi:sigma factor-like helix-turn-helix DNA-binding protein [Bacillus kexueae]|uniref:sigma factor-like helix-turn-helix DNA-binding protein n=1 Tax=Aeribacillus kexueae TaxID=2078952 RepID=UPI001FAF6E54|nr:sigma factor-like helix-turn-helix DNA-binding protein [Bacillus kexueae]
MERNHWIYELKTKWKDDRLLQSFLNKYDRLYKKALEHPVPTTLKKLDEAFQPFFFYIRFMAYVSKSIYFYVKNEMKKRYKYEQFHVLMLDKPLGDECGRTFKEQLSTNEDILSFLERDDRLEQHVTSTQLYGMVKKLTETEKTILTLSIFHQQSDVTIANCLDKSQQSVSKTKHRAFQKLRYGQGGEVLG